MHVYLALFPWYCLQGLGTVQSQKLCTCFLVANIRRKKALILLYVHNSYNELLLSHGPHHSIPNVLILIADSA